MLIEKDGVKHYCSVKSINRLLSSQVSKCKKKKFLFKPFNPFLLRDVLNKHQEYCNEHEAVKIELPEKGMMLKFKNYHRRDKVLRRL